MNHKLVATTGAFAAMTGLAATFAVGLALQYHQAQRYRDNAMDLCSWHARTIFADDPNVREERWRKVHNGLLKCPFCGQLHDKHWVSRNGWDSQVNAYIDNMESGKSED